MAGMSDTKPDPNLALLLEGVRAAVELLVAEPGEGRARAERVWEGFEARAREPNRTEPIARLVDRFGLSTLELRCVLLGLGHRIEPKMSSLVASAGRDLFSRALTVRLAIEKFSADAVQQIHARRAFAPSGTLLRNRIVALGSVEAGASEGLLARRYELTQPTVRYLLQEDELSDGVARVARLERPEVSLLNVILEPEEMRQVRELVEHHASYRKLITEWGFDRILPYGRGLTLLFSGPPGTGKTLLAHALASHARRPVISLSAADLPESEGVEATLRDLFSEATMRDALVLVDECEALVGKGDRRKATAFKAIEGFEGIVIMTTNHPEGLDEGVDRRVIYSLGFDLPEAAIRRQIWEVHLPPEVPLEGDIDLDALANTYDFAGGTIKNAILVAVNRALARNPSAPVLTMELLDEGCRSQLSYALEDLTVRSTTHLRLDDIVLPTRARRKVEEMIAAIRNRSVVLNRWGFGRKLVTGKGIISLFDGPPGTGKTLCAEIVAGEFDRPIYRVNIPEVVSKWVGETEKHIREIFQQARISHAMLLFDEADSLFSARVSEGKSATDRYANMEVNLLLQEIERFPGVCILTTNFYGSLDRALIRRVQFRVTFEEPDAVQRQRIWEVLCPPEVPLAPDVDWKALAESYELTGGMIKNALLRAAYWAADRGSELTQPILEESCMDEYVAAGKVARDPSLRAPSPRRGWQEAEDAAVAKALAEAEASGKAPPVVQRP